MARNLARRRAFLDLPRNDYAQDILGVLRIGLEAVGTLIFLRRLLIRGNFV